MTPVLSEEWAVSICGECSRVVAVRPVWWVVPWRLEVWRVIRCARCCPVVAPC